MKHLFLIFALAITLAGCGRTQKDYDRMLADADHLLNTHRVDSAETLLQGIDAADLQHDSLRAKYHYIMALSHLRQNRSMIADSLIKDVHKYYRGKDTERDIISGTMLAWYKFWTDDTPGAMSTLDSIIALPDVPDSLLLRPIRVRALLGAAEYSG